MVKQLIELGAPPDVVQAAKAEAIQAECLVFEDCWEAVQVFLALASQWRMVVGMGGVIYQGIDFAAIEPALRLLDVKKKNRKQLFLDLLLMSDEAAGAINSKQR